MKLTGENIQEWKCYFCPNQAKDILMLETGDELPSCRECTRETGNSVIDKDTGEKVFIPIVK